MEWDKLARECLAAGLGCAIADGTFNFLETTKVKLQVRLVASPTTVQGPSTSTLSLVLK